VDEILPSARQKPPPHGMHEEAAVKVGPPDEKVPTAHRSAKLSDVPPGKMVGAVPGGQK